MSAPRDLTEQEVQPRGPGMTFVCEGIGQGEPAGITHVQHCCDHIGGRRTSKVPPSAGRFPPPPPEDPEPEEEEVSVSDRSSSPQLFTKSTKHTRVCFPSVVPSRRSGRGLRPAVAFHTPLLA